MFNRVFMAYSAKDRFQLAAADSQRGADRAGRRLLAGYGGDACRSEGSPRQQPVEAAFPAAGGTAPAGRTRL